MTMGYRHRGRMSDHERAYFICALIPILWPFLLYFIITDVAWLLWQGLRWLGRQIARPFVALVPTCPHEWGAAHVLTWEDYEDHPGGPPNNQMFFVRYTQTKRTCALCGKLDQHTTREIL